MFRISISDQWKNLVSPDDVDAVIRHPMMHFMPNNSLAEDFVRYSMSGNSLSTEASTLSNKARAQMRIAVDYGCLPSLAWDVDENRYKLAFRVIDEEDAKKDLASVHRDYNNWLDAFIAEAESALATISS